MFSHTLIILTLCGDLQRNSFILMEVTPMSINCTAALTYVALVELTNERQFLPVAVNIFMLPVRGQINGWVLDAGYEILDYGYLYAFRGKHTESALLKQSLCTVCCTKWLIFFALPAHTPWGLKDTWRIQVRLVTSSFRTEKPKTFALYSSPIDCNGQEMVLVLSDFIKTHTIKLSNRVRHKKCTFSIYVSYLLNGFV